MTVTAMRRAQSAGARAAELRRPLLAWYDAGHRDLPWRRTTDPYRIWIAEVMLQQTRTAVVQPHYLHWLERFPDVSALATAAPAEVLQAWHGLGYYARARNLHRAARIVVQDLDGVLPGTAALWRRLPGVGAYTAGAVASIAFGERVAAVDDNVRRVIARWEAELGALTRQPAAGRVAALAAQAADCDRPGDVNQALMDLGALVCRPRLPLCSVCPTRGPCRAEATGRAGQLPARAPRPARPTVTAAAVVACSAQGAVLIARRSRSSHLAGLWEFPLAVHDGAPPAAAARSLLRALGLTPRHLREAAPVRHQFTHVRWLVTPVVASVTDGMAPAAGCLPDGMPGAYDEWTWVAAEDMVGRPTSRFMDKIVAAVCALA